MKHYAWAAAMGLVLLFLTSACQAFQSDDIGATVAADSARYVTEAAGIGQTALAQQTRVLSTAQAAETYVVSMNDINRQLLATVRVVNPPTAAVYSNPSAALAPAPNVEAGTPAPPTLSFSDINTAIAVRDSDGCPDVLQTEFSADTSRIYITARALNIRAGTRMSVQWSYDADGQVRFEEPWTVTSSASSFCFWFYAEPSNFEFTPGQWTARLFADGVA
ncbi:MAG: hypothetical protein H7175_08040, partial [Burkholderiales bacterium]|nr:hypothetical protein [Anaerolineae bacterium]